jgi:membrane-associated protease RseP (regulator of RpoE activity)
MSDPYPFPAVDAASPIQVFIVAPRRPRYFLAGSLLFITLFTTLVMGARLQYNFEHHLPAFSFENDFFPVGWAIFDLHNLMMGLPFAATLLGILLVHELGHYIGCRHYRVDATLPYFIPAPTLIGTFGAFIRIKSLIPSRRALFDIGIAGPIAGFAVAVPMTFIGLLLSHARTPDVPPSDVNFGMPLIFHLIHGIVALFSHELAVPLRDIVLHPVAVAAWVGMFATALNLIPGGQLDGGHILFAVLPRVHRTASRILALAMLPLGYFGWTGWLLWAVFLLFTGTRHPQVPLYPELTPRRRALAVFALLMLVLTFLPAPFATGGLHDLLRQMLSK